MIKQKRTRKMKMFDKERNYRGMESKEPSKEALREFERRPYQAAKMIRAQARIHERGAHVEIEKEEEIMRMKRCFQKQKNNKNMGDK